MEAHTSPTEGTTRRLPFFLAGVLLFVLGPVLYFFVQMQIPRFYMPWYVPILSTLGVVLMAISVWQRRGILRSVGLAAFVVLCGFQWMVLTVLTRTPAYNGPQVGSRLPEFAATLADGKTAFTNSYVDSDKHTVMLFYRGHW